MTEQPFTERGFVAGLGVGDDWGTTVRACLDRIGPVPPGACLGVLYATDSFVDDLASVVTFLREHTGVQDWVGTVGLGVAANGQEVYDRGALVLMLLSLPPESFQIFQPISDPGSGPRQDHSSWLERHHPVLGLVHGDPRNGSLQQVVQELSTELSTYLVGGLSAAQGATFPQVAGRVVEGGLSGVLFDDSLPVVAGLTQGCSPIGPTHEITACDRNVVKEIDGRSALEIFKEDIGELLAQDLRRVAGYIYAGFPVLGSDTGDYLVRNLTGIDPERGWIAVGEQVSTRQRLLFCRRDHDTAVRDLQRMLSDVTKRAAGAAKAGIYVSCVARGKHLFGPDSEELKSVRAAVGDIPLIGFFANGEICNDRIYGYTGVLTLFL